MSSSKVWPVCQDVVNFVLCFSNCYIVVEAVYIFFWVLWWHKDITSYLVGVYMSLVVISLVFLLDNRALFSYKAMQLWCHVVTAWTIFQLLNTFGKLFSDIKANMTKSMTISVQCDPCGNVPVLTVNILIGSLISSDRHTKILRWLFDRDSIAEARPYLQPSPRIRYIPFDITL